MVETTSNPVDEIVTDEVGAGEEGAGDRAREGAAAAGATTPDSTESESPASQTVDDSVDAAGVTGDGSGDGLGEDEWYSVVWVSPGR